MFAVIKKHIRLERKIKASWRSGDEEILSKHETSHSFRRHVYDVFSGETSVSCLCKLLKLEGDAKRYGGMEGAFFLSPDSFCYS